MQATTVTGTLSLGLLTNTAEHEESVDLHDVVEPWVGVGLGGVATGAKRTNEHLGEDRANLARSSGDTVRGGAVASWKACELC